MLNGTPMQRMRDRARKTVAPERIAALQARSVESAVETVATVEVAVATQAGALAAVSTDLAAAQADIVDLQTP